jgi:hypothetical protein
MRRDFIRHLLSKEVSGGCDRSTPLPKSPAPHRIKQLTSNLLVYSRNALFVGGVAKFIKERHVKAASVASMFFSWMAHGNRRSLPRAPKFIVTRFREDRRGCGGLELEPQSVPDATVPYCILVGNF